MILLTRSMKVSIGSMLYILSYVFSISVCNNSAGYSTKPDC